MSSRPNMSPQDGFDPYWEWLRIPAGRRPPTYYELLDLPQFEANTDRIRQAATRRMSIVLRYRLGERAAESQHLQHELSRALNCLGDAAQKRLYDARLGESAPTGASATGSPSISKAGHAPAPIPLARSSSPAAATGPPSVTLPPSPADLPSVPIPIQAITTPATVPTVAPSVAAPLAVESRASAHAGASASGGKLVDERRRHLMSRPRWQRLTAVTGAVALVFGALLLMVPGREKVPHTDPIDERVAQTNTPDDKLLAPRLAGAPQPKASDTTAAENQREQSSNEKRSLRLSPIAQVRLRAGDPAIVEVAVERQNCVGAVDVRLVGLPAKVAGNSIVIAADETKGQFEVVSAVDCTPNLYTAIVHAKLDYLETTIKVRVRIDARQAVGDEKVDPLTTSAPTAAPAGDADVAASADSGTQPADEFENSIGMKFRRISAGNIGILEKENEWDAKRQQFLARSSVRTLQVAQAFYMAAHEVTQAQYHAVTGANPSKLHGGELPVDSVSMTDADSFCQLLTERERSKGVLPNDMAYRLPTDDEWEYAARAGATTLFCFGNDDKELANYAWYGQLHNGSTHPVGTKRANAWGLYDMHGNVSEWSSRYKLQGGAFYLPASGLRFNYGTSMRSENRSQNWSGFRAAMVTEQPVLAPAAPIASGTSSSPAASAEQATEMAIVPFTGDQAKAYQQRCAARLNVEPVVTNSLGMKLAVIPPGEFLMGSPYSDKQADQNEKPRHRVWITRPFYIGVCEITQRQYQDVTGTNPSDYSRGGQEKDKVEGLDTDQFPVDSVSWYDAVAFCNALSKREDLSAYYSRDRQERNKITVLGGSGYRLPTEAEWEYACRAGTATRRSCGDDEAVLHQHAWSRADKRTHRAAELAANPFGLFDMYGNIEEWCWDRHSFYWGEAVSDPVGATTGGMRVTRGNYYDYWPERCSSAARQLHAPEKGNSSIGFRVARNCSP